MDELSPQAEAKDMKLAPTLSRFEAARTLGRFPSYSGKIQICFANLCFLPSLQSKRPRCPLLSASVRSAEWR